jgi:pimeloyl-ACP methyl ester carboxylesterase
MKRLSLGDALFLHAETPETPMHVASVTVFRPDAGDDLFARFRDTYPPDSISRLNRAQLRRRGERIFRRRSRRKRGQEMTAVQANGITIEYEEKGPPDSPVILLIMGLGMQLIAWPESFCEGLAARGFRIVRFDNRDAGLSSRMPSAGSLAIAAMMARALFGLPVRPPYTLDDMARDTVGLMDALGIGQAHVVGASMGGMIAQIVAIEHPERVKSLTSIMSTSGDRALRGARCFARARAIRRWRSAATWRCSASSAAPAIRRRRPSYSPGSSARCAEAIGPTVSGVK